MNIKGSTVIDGRLLTNVSALSQAAIASIERGDCYSWNAATAALADNDTAIMVCNDDPDRVLYIEMIYIWLDVAGEMDVHFPDYATWAGTAIAAVNMNDQFRGKKPSATAFADETGQGSQGSILTSLHTNELATDQFGQFLWLNGIVQLGYHKAIAVDADTAAGVAEFNATVIGYYE